MPFCSDVILATAVLASLATVGLRAESSLTEPLDPPAAGTPRVVSVVRVDPRTGRLVRSIVVKQDGQNPLNVTPEVRAMIEETAKNLDVSPLLVDSVIQVESSYNPYAVSPKGAQGLMQLMPATARRFGVKNSFDAKQNVEGGVRYLKFLQDTFQDDRLVIAAYNAGEKAVAKYGSVPPYPETVGYVAKVGRKYGDAKRAAKKDTAHSSSVAEKPKPAEDEPRHVIGYMDQEGRLHIATR